MDRRLKWLKGIAVPIILIGFFYVAVIGCNGDNNASPGKPSPMPAARDATYLGEPARVGKMAEAALYFLRKHQWRDLETTVRALIAANEKARDDRALIGNYVLLGIALKMQGKEAQELEAYRQEREIARRLKPPDAASECDALMNTGNAYAQRQDFGRAAAAFREARDIARQYNLRDEIRSAENNLALAEQRAESSRRSPLWGDLPASRAGARTCDIHQARKLVSLSRDLIKNNPGFNICALAVNQPDFPGVIGEEGAMVRFDDQGNPVQVITTRHLDYRTGLLIDTRTLTQEEIAEASFRLKDYHSKINPTGKIIVIFSDSFRAAACETLLNADEKTRYYLKREGAEARLHKFRDGVDEVIAAEAIYF